MHCSRIVHETHNHFIQKNIKNRSHDTIYTFENYFVTVFLVFSKISCIQMDPKFTKNIVILESEKYYNLWYDWTEYVGSKFKIIKI